VQVDPIRLKLKPPGTKRLKLNCDALLSTSAFKFNLCRYTVEVAMGTMLESLETAGRLIAGYAFDEDEMEAGAYTRSLSSST